MQSKLAQLFKAPKSSQIRLRIVHPFPLHKWSPRSMVLLQLLLQHFWSSPLTSTSQPLLISTAQPLHCPKASLISQNLPFHSARLQAVPSVTIISMAVSTTRYATTSHRTSLHLTHPRWRYSVSTPMAAATSQQCRPRSMPFQITAGRGMLFGSTRASTCKQFSLFRLSDPFQNSALRFYWVYCYWSHSIVPVRRWRSQHPSPTSHFKGRGLTLQRLLGMTPPNQRTAHSIVPQSPFSHQDSLRKT